MGHLLIAFQHGLISHVKTRITPSMEFMSILETLNGSISDLPGRILIWKYMSVILGCQALSRKCMTLITLDKMYYQGLIHWDIMLFRLWEWFSIHIMDLLDIIAQTSLVFLRDLELLRNLNNWLMQHMRWILKLLLISCIPMLLRMY